MAPHSSEIRLSVAPKLRAFDSPKCGTGPLIFPLEDRSRIRPIGRFLSDRILEQIGQILSDQDLAFDPISGQKGYLLAPNLIFLLAWSHFGQFPADSASFGANITKSGHFLGPKKSQDLGPPAVFVRPGPRLWALGSPFLSVLNLGLRLRISKFCPTQDLSSQGIIRGPFEPRASQLNSPVHSFQRIFAGFGRDKGALGIFKLAVPAILNPVPRN